MEWLETINRMDGREYNCQKVTTNGQEITTQKMGVNPDG